jgi:DNA-binding NtrC family response regulator
LTSTDTHRDPPGGSDASPEPALFLSIEIDNLISPQPLRLRLGDVTSVVVGRGDRGAEPHPGKRHKLRLPDPCMSGRHATLSRTARGWVVEDHDSKNGTWMNGVQVKRAALKDGDVIELGHTFFLFRDTWAFDARDRAYATVAEPPAPMLATVVPDHARLFAAVARVADSPEPILLCGESGAGKEEVARAVHALSRRRGAFFPVNCAALAEDLLDSELFGHVRGAFTGAVDRKASLFEMANGGTVFLDEIGELSSAAQAKLLRVIEEGALRPVGSTKPIPIDGRMLSATNRDLDLLVTQGRFRADLLARLGERVTLPPLRDRREDLGLIAAEILRSVPASKRFKCISLTREAARALLRHEWPMNIRELRQCLTHAVLFSDDGIIDLEHLSESVRDVHAEERKALAKLMRKHHGKIAAVARALKKTRKQMYADLARLGLDPDDFRRG